MLQSKMHKSLLLLLLAISAAGCSGSVQFDGSLGGKPFAPVGTVFAYFDETDDNFRRISDPPLIIAMTWLTFDPRSDLGARSGAELANMRHELALRDAASFIVPQQSLAVPAATFSEETIAGVVQEGSTMRATLQFAPDPLNGSSSYLDLPPLASQRTIALNIDSIERIVGGTVSGDLNIAFASVGSEALQGPIRVGSLRGVFNAPIVEEKLAERNLALLGTRPLLGIPLTDALELPDGDAPLETPVETTDAGNL